MNGEGNSFVGAIEWIVDGANDILWTYVLIALLIGLGIYFTIRSNFVQFRLFGEMFKVITEKSTISKEGKRGVSSFQAFCISTASRVGTGNLAGVALAVSLGGPGAVFWMWLIALLGAATAFIESTLAQVYKVKDGENFRGGPAYYMEKALKARWLGISFAILITLCFGFIFNMVQANTISHAFENAYGVNRAVVGAVLALLAGLIFFGGVQRIAKVTQVIVPVMAVIYLVFALGISIVNITELPAVISLIIANAFGLEEVVGGGLGAALMQGIRRGLFSNEAGMGSVPNAAATADVKHPAKQGLVQSLGVFVDTLVICTATAFVILLTDVYTLGEEEGIAITQMALSEHIGGWAVSFLAIAILLFAFSSIVGNYYYGETNMEFVKKNKFLINFYRFAVMGMVFLGALAELSLVWNMADLFMGLMAVMNLAVIAILGKLALKVLKDYQEQRKTQSEPVFRADRIEGLTGTECWDGEEEQRQAK
ncbi:alanine:cation symporter family protein [Bacillus sp. H-16]|uniref:alanine/glycine:cation symporter family protein n=1 Tax=Alteribacter salitolerans TaxID=2912333 RepID=UPI001963A20C|nr:alanine/glycine:cation symporter family protein [Alteribacter salitolerans]MBM7094945.1 alanine:cation symporter family protein [Alteribacter salitolerans]